MHIKMENEMRAEREMIYGTGSRKKYTKLQRQSKKTRKTERQLQRLGI